MGACVWVLVLVFWVLVLLLGGGGWCCCEVDVVAEARCDGVRVVQAWREPWCERGVVSVV